MWRKIRRRLATIWLEWVTGFLWWGVGNLPSHHLRRFFYRLAGVEIGAGSTIHMRARLYDPRHLVIGQDTIIGEQATLDARRQLTASQGGITIGDHVAIASQVMIWTSKHDLGSPDFAPREAPVVIEDYVFIGPRAIILPGVRIGRGAVVAAGAVVTKSVPTGVVVAGVPAREIGPRASQAWHYRLGRARWFQ